MYFVYIYFVKFPNIQYTSRNMQPLIRQDLRNERKRRRFICWDILCTLIPSVRVVSYTYKTCGDSQNVSLFLLARFVNSNEMDASAYVWQVVLSWKLIRKCFLCMPNLSCLNVSKKQFTRYFKVYVLPVTLRFQSPRWCHKHLEDIHLCFYNSK